MNLYQIIHYCHITTCHHTLFIQSECFALAIHWWRWLYSHRNVWIYCENWLVHTRWPWLQYWKAGLSCTIYNMPSEFMCETLQLRKCNHKSDCSVQFIIKTKTPKSLPWNVTWVNWCYFHEWLITSCCILQVTLHWTGMYTHTHTHNHPWACIPDIPHGAMELTFLLAKQL